MSTIEETNEKRRSVQPKQSKETLSRKHSERHQVVQVQNYIIYRKTIGAGSMGKVKLAECLTDVQKQKYAVKIMPKVDLENISSRSKSKDPKDTPEEREQRTIREMAIMRLLRHPNICQLKEYISEGDKYYMFLEYIDGGQLLDYIIKHGKLKEKQARKFARQIVSALDYCHRNSIVHRDLKIENILITQSEQLKIIDFGLSNVYSPTHQLNTFCGSLYFAAPELLKAKEYTGPEVDVWSFGVVLYVLVCGKVPFDDTNLPALHEKIKSGLVEEYPDHLGKECIDLLTRIFVVDPRQRITLSEIKTHPWMNKGYEEPIRNYLPHRQPIEKIDMDIVKGMHGFGLGKPEEIKQKLESVISSPAYRSAALKIEQNFQKNANDDQEYASRPRWRRSLSTRRRTIDKDDFKSLPAMYNPLVSIYYLVKERKESDERKQRLLNAEPNPIGLSRSTSTLVKQPSKSSIHSDTLKPIGLSRRRTFDTSKKLPDPLKPAPTPTPSKSEKFSTRLSRKKSFQQVVKKMGLRVSEEEPEMPVSNHSETTSKKSSKSSDTSRKLNWLKLELNSQSAAKLQQPRPSSESAASRSGWKRLSIHRKSRLSFEYSSGNLPTQLDPMPSSLHIKKSNSSTSTKKKSFEKIVDKALPPLVLETSKSEGIHKSKSSPKSLFQFNRAQLFRIAPEIIISHLLDILNTLKIHVVTTTEPFKLMCDCDYSVWHKFISPYYETTLPPATLLQFSILVYEARWAGKKFGFKLKESHDNPSGHLERKQILRDLYHYILSQFEKRVESI